MPNVIIKGMEMPTSCDKCIYSAWSNFYQIYVCNAVRKNEPVLFDGKQTKSTAVSSARADNCPLRPAPEWIGLVLSKYDENKEKSWIRDPVAYTLYEVWKIMDSKVSYRPSGGGDGDG